MPTRTIREANAIVRLAELRRKWRMKHPQQRWRKGAQVDPPPVSEKADGKKGKQVY